MLRRLSFEFAEIKRSCRLRKNASCCAFSAAASRASSSACAICEVMSFLTAAPERNDAETSVGGGFTAGCTGG